MKLGLSCFLAFAGVFALAQQPSPRDDFVLVGETAYGMLNAETICSSSVNTLAWSDDGKYLLAIRTDMGPLSDLRQFVASGGVGEPELERSIVLYDVAARKQTVVWRGKGRQFDVSDARWLSGSDTAVVTFEERVRTTDPTHPNQSRQTITLIDARSSEMKIVTRIDQEGGQPDVELMLAPRKALGLLVLRTFDRTQPGPIPGDDARVIWHFEYRVLSATGGLGALIPLKPNESIGGWGADGISPFIVSMQKGTDGKLKAQEGLLDLSSGAITPVDHVKPYDEKPPTLILQASQAGGSIKADKVERRLHPFWLKASASAESQALICSDATCVTLSPTLSGVAYVSQGVAVVRPIIQLPKDMFLQALKAAERTRALSNAKQVGLALIMYANDMDDTFPNSQSDIGKLIDPYLGDSNIFAGFVYSFGGGLMQDIKDPANTIMGYMPGPGGKAVLYADGHVKWQSDQ